MNYSFFHFLARMSEFFDHAELIERQAELLSMYSQGATEAQAAWVLKAQGALEVVS